MPFSSEISACAGKLTVHSHVFCCSLTPHKSELFNLESVVISENFPLTAVSMFAAAGPHYSHALAQVVSRANNVYGSFMRSEEGRGFCGQVGIVFLQLVWHYSLYLLKPMVVV